MNLDIEYICSSPENLNIKKKFDILLNMEIVEHVDDVNLFIHHCSKLIKKDGIMFVATLNKNLKSFLLGIIGAEYILRWLPIGTHDWGKFLEPKDLENILINNDFLADETVGMKFNLLSNKWHQSTDTSVNYISTFLKN
jgi:2-polyprenyl-6-hydroxyphenyl methylase/3-demethylubiquinone-9 3-methyltransferase